MVQDKKSINKVINANKSQILSCGVSKLGIFGSFVRNEQNENSDIDFYVEFVEGKKNFDNFINLSFLLEELFGRRVELVTKESLSPHFGYKILNEIEYVTISD